MESFLSVIRHYPIDPSVVMGIFSWLRCSLGRHAAIKSVTPSRHEGRPSPASVHASPTTLSGCKFAIKSKMGHHPTPKATSADALSSRAGGNSRITTVPEYRSKAIFLHGACIGPKNGGSYVLRRCSLINMDQLPPYPRQAQTPRQPGAWVVTSHQLTTITR